MGGPNDLLKLLDAWNEAASQVMQVREPVDQDLDDAETIAIAENIACGIIRRGRLWRDVAIGAADTHASFESAKFQDKVGKDWGKYWDGKWPKWIMNGSDNTWCDKHSLINLSSRGYGWGAIRASHH